MPYNSASAQQSITIAALTVGIDVSPAAPWTAGQTVTVYGSAFLNSTPLSGRTLRFAFIESPSGKSVTIGEKTTGTDGKASITYTIPWTVDSEVVPCGDAAFRVLDVATGTVSPLRSGKVAYPTQLTISAPGTWQAGQNFLVSGYLKYQSSPGVWTGLGGKTVSLYLDTTKLGDVTTASDGYYERVCNIGTPGTYTLKAAYAGEGFTAAAAAFLGLTVSPQTKSALSFALPLLTGAIVAFASLKAKR
jgi:hypothetical protein